MKQISLRLELNALMKNHESHRSQFQFYFFPLFWTVSFSFTEQLDTKLLFLVKTKKTKQKRENRRNVAEMMLLSSNSHLNCLRFAGKISVSELNL